jgi:hypothetical protein
VGSIRRGGGAQRVHFVYLYESRRMKPVEIVLRTWGRRMREDRE